jgi:hypothetical protein
LSTIDEKLKIVNDKFRKGSKSHQAARYIVRQNRDITDEEKEAISKEIPIATKTLEGVFTKLKKLDLYGVPYSYEPEIIEPQVTEDDPQLPQSNQYATIEDLRSLEGKVTSSLNYITSLLKGNNPDSLESENEDVEIPSNPESATIEDTSMKQMGTWIQAKHLIFYDLAKEGAFTGALREFEGNWSDFVNIVFNDYFSKVHNVGVGLLSRRFV